MRQRAIPRALVLGESTRCHDSVGYLSTDIGDEHGHDPEPRRPPELRASSLAGLDADHDGVPRLQALADELFNLVVAAPLLPIQPSFTRSVNIVLVTCRGTLS